MEVEAEVEVRLEGARSPEQKSAQSSGTPESRQQGAWSRPSARQLNTAARWAEQRASSGAVAAGEAWNMWSRSQRPAQLLATPPAAQQAVMWGWWAERWQSTICSASSGST